MVSTEMQNPETIRLRKNRASQIEGMPVEFPAEVIEEHPPCPDSWHGVCEEVQPEPDAVPDTSDAWGFTSTEKKGKRVKRPAYDCN